MNSILKIIRNLSPQAMLTTVKPINRYGISVKTKEDLSSQFFFSVPVYKKDKHMVEPCFVSQETYYLLRGSNSTIKIFDEGIRIETEHGYVRINWSSRQTLFMYADGSGLRSDTMEIFPTLNGLVIRQKSNYKPTLLFEPELDSVGHIQYNSKCFAYMREKFEPYVTLSAMYADSWDGMHFYGLTMIHENKNNGSICLEMQADHKEAAHFVWEVSAYEPKLFQDTTVESRRPAENNVYGNVAHIGSSFSNGVQYLYSRLDLSKLPQDSKKNIEKAYLHIPYYMIDGHTFRISSPFKRFCSFGSRWNNKIGYKDINVNYYRKNGFVTFDLSEYLLNQKKELQERTGFVLRSVKSDSFSILATGDNHFTPQVLELQYKTKENKNEV